ncbi:hypothetical protein BN1708_010099 [Verticillium longisporum]|nr:hypothetical protein BN1708_010099 [Verticillium longisporum]
MRRIIESILDYVLPLPDTVDATGLLIVAIGLPVETLAEIMPFSSSSSTLRSFFSSNGSSKLDYSKKICGEFDKLNLNKNEIQTSIDDMVSWIQILLGKASQPKEYCEIHEFPSVSLSRLLDIREEARS